MDLAIALCILVFSAVTLFRMCRRYGANRPLVSQIAVGTCLALATWLSWTTTYSLTWAQIIPHGSVLLLANASLILLVAAAGFLFGDTRVRSFRRLSMSAILIVTAAYGICSVMVRPFLQPVRLSGHGQWEDGVCLQTHEASCAAAAAATLLGQHGIASSERQMAAQCLTSRHGTLSLAAYRGIQVESERSGYATRAIVCPPASLPAVGIDDHLPMFALVSFADQLKKARRFRPGLQPAGQRRVPGREL